MLPAGANGAILHFGGGGIRGPGRPLTGGDPLGVGAVGDVALAVGGEFSNATASQRG